MLDRLAQDFVVDWSYIRHVEPYQNDKGELIKPGDVELTRELIESSVAGFPGFSILIRMIKPKEDS
jgi:hypothetical protein